jgi:beta-lactamase class D
MTKELLYDQTLPSGWALYGKTGSGFYLNEANKIAWYVGWIEKGSQQYAFALLYTGLSTFPSKEDRQELVKQFFKEASISL